MKYIWYGIAILAIGTWLRIGWVMFYPYKPIEVHAVNILDEDNTVTAGENLNYETVYTKHMMLRAEVQRRLINSYVLTVPTYTRSVPLGHGRTKNYITIPEFADPGVYRLSIVWTYQVSDFPARIINVEAISAPFLVVKKDHTVNILKKALLGK